MSEYVVVLPFSKKIDYHSSTWKGGKMITADIVVLSSFGISALFGLVLGFGKGLKLFTSGIFGMAISLLLCYCFGGMILNLSFVQELLKDFSSLWMGKEGAFYAFLENSRMELVLYYIVLFLMLQAMRVLLVKLIRGFMETDVLLMKVINRTLGLLLFVLIFFFVLLLVFQIISWIGHDTETKFLTEISGSRFHLDDIYHNNPLNGLMKLILPKSQG